MVHLHPDGFYENFAYWLQTNGRRVSEILFLPVSRRIDIPTVRFLDRFKASETSLCNVFREQASRHMSENSPVNLVCLNCLCGGCYVMRYVRRTLVTVSEM